MTMTLAGKVAVVTGGAGGGIGAAICLGLAEAGCAVVVGYNSSEEAARVLAARIVREAIGFDPTLN